MILGGHKIKIKFDILWQWIYIMPENDITLGMLQAYFSLIYPYKRNPEYHAFYFNWGIIGLINSYHYKNK